MRVVKTKKERDVLDSLDGTVPVNETHSDSNPFIGNVRNKSAFDLPYELRDGEEVETLVFAPKREKKKASKLLNNPCISLNGRAIPKIFTVHKKEFSFEEHKETWKRHKSQSKIEKLDKMTTDVLKVDKKTKAKFIGKYDRFTKSFIRLLVEEIIPIENAFENSIETTKQMMELISESDISEINVGAFRAMLRDSLNMKIVSHLTEALDLTESQAQTLLEKHFTGTSKKDFLETLLTMYGNKNSGGQK